MKQFTDANGNAVKLALGEKNIFTNMPGHVLVLTRYKKEWMLTNHSVRGYEFPGGKVEDDESVEEAAAREVWEETGGIVKNIAYVGQYQVTETTGKTFWKTIFAAQIEEFKERDEYGETKGPVFMQELPLVLKADPCFSFIMKDEVVPIALAYAIEQGIFT